MVRETWVQFQVVSYQRLLKWYLILPCLTLSNIRYVSRVKWSNPGKAVAPSPISRWSSYCLNNSNLVDFGLASLTVIQAKMMVQNIKMLFCPPRGFDLSDSHLFRSLQHFRGVIVLDIYLWIIVICLLCAVLDLDNKSIVNRSRQSASKRMRPHN